MEVVTMRKYYSAKDANAETDELKGRPVFDLNNRTHHRSDTDTIEDEEESNAVLAYLSSVAKQSREGPVAVVADIPAPYMAETTCIPTKSATINYQDLLLSDHILQKKVDVFSAVRDSIQSSQRSDRVSKSIDFLNEDPSIYNFSVLDYSSVARDLESLPTLIYELPTSKTFSWLFRLLAVVEFPLLEDTQHALQVLRKFCESDDSEVANVLAAIIASIFGQR